MIKLDFWLAIIIVFIGALILLITAIKFLRKMELRDKIVGIGLLCVSIALILNGIFYMYHLFVGIYWMYVELFHIIGIILITLGILNVEANKNVKNTKTKNKKQKNK